LESELLKNHILATLNKKTQKKCQTNLEDQP
jgi:hypothetical protein